MKKNKNKNTRSTQSNTNWQHWADAPVPTEPQPSRRFKARRQFKEPITWCNGHEGPRMDKRFKQMPDTPERSFAILLDRRDSLEWKFDKDGKAIGLVRNKNGNFTCTKCNNQVSESTVLQLNRRIQRHDLCNTVNESIRETHQTIIDRENAAYMAQELSQ